MTVSDRHRQRAAELLDDVHSGWCGAASDYPAGPGKGDGRCICRLKGRAEAIAAALADAEQQAVAPVLALAEELEAEAARHDDAEPVSRDGLTRMILAARHCREHAHRIWQAAAGGGR